MNNIFLYWQNPQGKLTPPYIELCIESIFKHCSKDFKIYLLNDQSVYDLLPESRDIYSNIAQINNRSNYLRYYLLKKFGGVWLDCDCVIFKNLKPLLELINDSMDLLATASPSLTEPECGILISKPNGKIITKAVQLIDYELSLHEPQHIFQWGGLGPSLLRRSVKGLSYYHLDSKLLQFIKSWEAWRFDSIESIEKYYNSDIYGCMLYHQMFTQVNSPILTMTKNQLIESPKLIGQIFRLVDRITVK